MADEHYYIKQDIYDDSPRSLIDQIKKEPSHDTFSNLSSSWNGKKRHHKSVIDSNKELTQNEGTTEKRTRTKVNMNKLIYVGCYCGMAATNQGS